MDQYHLTPRQRQVVWLLAQGCTTMEIAARLEISQNTVKIHLRTVYEKLGADTAAHAVALAHEHKQIMLERDPQHVVTTKHHLQGRH
jgi:DNA-binding CsgD family transcriptional regulator